MDPNLAQPPQQSQPIQQTPPEVIVQPKKPFNKLLLIPVVIVLLIAAIIGIFVTTRKNVPTQATQAKISPTPQMISGNTLSTKDIPYTVFYGVTSQNTTDIYTYSIQKQTNKLVAQLPKPIKRVTVLPEGSYLFINNTDEYDNGTEIAKFSEIDASVQSILHADSGYFIDDYAISPDRKSMALWEISPNPATHTLLGGKSRVYAVNLTTPVVKHLLFDEAATESAALHYPSSIQNDGSVYLDTFVPNDGAGWAHGVTVSNNDGSVKEDMSNMKNGTYGTKLIPSPKGDYMAFGGYDGSFGPGETLQDGFRIATIRVNTIELLRTTDNQRMKLPGVSEKSIYANFRWSADGNVLYFDAIGLDAVVSGPYMYDISKKKLTKLPLEKGKVTVAGITSDILLGGEPVKTLTSLGYTYTSPYTNLSVMSLHAKAQHVLTILQKEVMYIATLPDDGSHVLAAETTSADGKKSIQLKTFTPSVSPTEMVTQSVTPTVTVIPTPTVNVPEHRETQQSNPPPPQPGVTSAPSQQKPACRDLYAAQLNAACGPQPQKPPASASPEEQAAQYEKISAWNMCLDGAIGSHYQDGTCLGSPLYLYGTNGTHVSVKVWTPVFNALPSDTNGAFGLTLGEKGNFSADGHTYDSLVYDYTSALHNISAPTKGYSVTKNSLQEAVLRLAKALSLNQKETTDLQASLQNKMTSTYAVLSFYDQTTSKKILPITFSPEPDTYINYVFYLKNLSSPLNYSLQPPVVSEMHRTGFTAVEISEIIE